MASGQKAAAFKPVVMFFCQYCILLEDPLWSPFEFSNSFLDYSASYLSTLATFYLEILRRFLYFSIHKVSSCKTKLSNIPNISEKNDFCFLLINYHQFTLHSILLSMLEASFLEQKYFECFNIPQPYYQLQQKPNHFQIGISLFIFPQLEASISLLSFSFFF